MGIRFFGDTSVQGWTQLYNLVVALVLCSAIGLERQRRRKSAGLRTVTLVGLGSALFMLISKYGFGDVLQGGTVMLDPSRVAAQIVSGIGFIGAGLIFVRQDAVRGLTTAAVVWIAAAVGTAAGAGLPILAFAVMVAHFLVVYLYPPLLRLLPGGRRRVTDLRVRYADGQGVLRRVLSTVTSTGFAVTHVDAGKSADGRVAVEISVLGEGDLGALAARMSDVDGVVAVSTGDEDESEDLNA